MGKRPNILILAILTVSMVGLVSVLLSRGREPQITLPNSQGPSYSPPVARAGASQETTVGSPDGKWALKMKEEKGKDETTYVFLVLDSADSSQKEIFRKTVPVTSVMTIPANTFSPDGKYVFLKETGEAQVSYFVLSITVSPGSQNTPIAEISELFTGRYPDYKITEVTGWGGVNLIIFNTEKAGGAIGPSFWFEVPGGGFTRLSTKFN